MRRPDAVDRTFGAHATGMVAFVLLVALAAGCAASTGESGQAIPDDLPPVTDEDLARFERVGLETDFSRYAVDPSLLLSGGPVKDAIPALSDPEMVSVEEADADLLDETRGILVEFDGEARFYPFSILVWHEIVNDSIQDTHFAATF
jgi:hypothetical protein